MTELFLTLDDAVIVAKREFGIDKQIAGQEFEQKCFVSNDQYAIGYNDGIYDSIKALSKLMNGGNTDDGND